MQQRDALVIAGLSVLGLVGFAVVWGRRRRFSRHRFVPSGNPRTLGRTDDYGATQSATVYVGQDRGLEPANRRGACAAKPRAFSVQTLDREFLRIRRQQVGKENTGGTRTTGKGWYQGKPEKAAAYEVVFIPNKHESSYDKFRQNMNRLAEKMGKKLCQDAVIVVHNDGDRRRSCGAVWYERGRGTC